MALSAVFVTLEANRRGAGMAESEQSQRKSRRADDREVEELAPADTAHKAELDSEVDSLLDEIDDVLEVNAEEFVRSFVQKGGQ
jgi:ubiquitin-like protein Pup